MASWASVICTSCNSKILHSQVPKRGLTELFLPSRPEVRVSGTISCPKCQIVVSYVQADLRYLASD
jgi:hypothetical protein